MDCSMADFEIIKPITRGAFGRVFLVKLRNRNKASPTICPSELYAMKVLHRSGITQSKIQKRLILEYEILENLSHDKNDFIVNLVSSFQTQSNFYLIMQFQAGGDLYSFLTAMGYFSEEVAKQYLCEIVLAVEFLHAHNIVHCDLKPDNLLIGADGHLRLTDFGMSFEAMFDQIDNDSETNSVSTDRKVTLPSAPSLASPGRFARMTFDTTDSENDTNHVTPPKASETSQLFRPSNPQSSISSPEKNNSPRSRLSRQRRLRSHSISDFQSKLAVSQIASVKSHHFDTQSDTVENCEDSLAPQSPTDTHLNLTSFHIRGTPDYIAPEIIQASPYSTTFSVDWWAVGIIFFEMLSGSTPFNASTRDDVFDNILDQDIDTIMAGVLPEDVSDDARSLIRGLLEKNPENRLGTKHGVSEIKNHPYFADVDWDNVYHTEPVFSPSFDGETTTQYFDPRDERFPVKLIDTDDVNEDILNARKERALKHFDEVSGRLSRVEYHPNGWLSGRYVTRRVRLC